MARIQIGTCSGPADAALVKSAFEAHRIPVLINAEQHASMLAGLGGAIVPLHIFVDTEHADEATALLADLRAHEHDAATEEEREADAEDARELAAIDSDRVARRRKQGTILVIVLGGAVALPFVTHNPTLAALLLVACIAAIVVTLRPESPIPRATIKRPKK